jgi:hypothetical protein
LPVGIGDPTNDVTPLDSSKRSRYLLLLEESRGVISSVGSVCLLAMHMPPTIQSRYVRCSSIRAPRVVCPKPMGIARHMAYIRAEPPIQGISHDSQLPQASFKLAKDKDPTGGACSKPYKC